MMGGRGSSSSRGISAIRVDYGDGRSSSFRKGPGNTITDLDMNGAKDTNGLTLSQIAERAKANGYTVKTYTSAQLKSYDQERKQEQAEKPDYELGYGVPWGNKEYRKAARRNRINTRAQRRR